MFHLFRNKNHNDLIFPKESFIKTKISNDILNLKNKINFTFLEIFKTSKKFTSNCYKLTHNCLKICFHIVFIPTQIYGEFLLAVNCPFYYLLTLIAEVECKITIRRNQVAISP